MKTYGLSIQLYGLIIHLLAVQPTYAGEPGWAKDMPKRIGKFLFVSCHGLGPDKDVAYRQAIDQCRSIASDQISGTFKVKTLSMESEESAGFHQEVTTDSVVEGLSCHVENSAEEEGESYKVYLRCKFDTLKARIRPVESVKFDRKPLISSANKSLIVSTVPHCDSLVIRGKISRMIRCSSNPQAVSVYPEDFEVLVRAKGYQPKHAEIPEGDTLEVYLERN